MQMRDAYILKNITNIKSLIHICNGRVFNINFYNCTRNDIEISEHIHKYIIDTKNYPRDQER